MLFWIAITLTAALVAVILAFSFRRDTAETTGEADMALYRDQLAEVDRDEARGVLNPEEAGRVRVEVSRRLLAADRMAREGAGATHGRGPLAPALLIGVLAAGGAILLYQRLGAPDRPDAALAARLAAADRAMAARPAQAEAEAQFGTPWTRPEGVADDDMALIEQLREAVAKHPDSLEGWLLLVGYESRLGNWSGAAAAQAEVVALKGDKATADDQVMLATLMIEAAGGFVSPEAGTALQRALGLDPANGMARYYMGLMYAEGGRYDLTMRFWPRLLESSPPDAPWVRPVRAEIEAVAAAAGIPYTLPPADATAAAPPAGPDAGDIAAAEGMDTADREAMIRGMVDDLDARLAQGGGTAEEWARLIISLGVLGEADRARVAWETARDRFAGDAQALETLERAAVSAGIAG